MILNFETLDEDGYPTEELLDYIASYTILEGSRLELMQLVYDHWCYDYPYKQYYQDSSSGQWVYTMSTGGWSGNEALIHALMDNQLWWILNWVSSRRGGHHEFHVKDLR